jgi:phosphohistidine phosphatase
MNLLIVRHAIAEEREQFATHCQDDRRRPLSDKGRRRMAQGAAGLQRLFPKLDYLISSPLVRARQTAEILAGRYPAAQVLEWPELAPGGGAPQVAARLAELPTDATVGLVGHEPDLSELVAWLTDGVALGFLRFKKGGACLLRSPELPAAGSAELLWALDPKQLRQLGSAD